MRAFAIERGIVPDLEIVAVDPFAETIGDLEAANPLGRVPALQRPDGHWLADSAVICDWLDGAGPGPRWLPQEGDARTEVLDRIASADGLMETALKLVMERRRPESGQSEMWKTRWRGAILRAVAAARPPSSGRFGLGEIGLACALS